MGTAAKEVGTLRWDSGELSILTIWTKTPNLMGVKEMPTDPIFEADPVTRMMM